MVENIIWKGRRVMIQLLSKDEQSEQICFEKQQVLPSTFYILKRLISIQKEVSNGFHCCKF